MKNVFQPQKVLNLLLFFFLISNLSFGQAASVSPTKLIFQAVPGTSETLLLRVKNNSDKKQTYKLKLGDWLRDSVGGHRYYDPNTLPQSCSPWLKLDHPLVELEPQQEKEIGVTLTVPNDTTGKQTRWSMVFVEIGELASSNVKVSKSAEIKEIYRIGVHVYQTPPNATQDAAKALWLKKDPKTNQWNFMIQNTGNTMLDCSSHLEVVNLTTSKAEKLAEQTFPVFPGGKRMFTFEAPSLPKGKYSILAVLDYGESNPLEAIEKTIEIK